MKKEMKPQKKSWLSGNQMRKRSLIVTLCFTLIMSLLCVRVGFIQFVKGAEYQKLATNQQTKTRVITAKRGTIYDRNGNTLAVSATVYRVSINPRDIKKDEKHKQDVAAHQQRVASKMAEILDLEYTIVYEKVMKSNSYQEIKRKVEDDAAEKLRQWIQEEDIFGVYIDEDAKRYYPNNTLASHVIGFTGTDDQGLAGIESLYEDYLKGKNGYILTEVDGARQSMPLSEEVRIDPQSGNNVVLTIDETIQYLVEKSLENSIKGLKVSNGAACIVMDPKTGEILAMASNPSFDLNQPFAFPNITGDKQLEKLAEKYNWTANARETWKGRTAEEVKILNETVWRNKALSDTYEPGSTFKTITSAAALEEGIITKNSTVNDTPYSLLGATIRCWRKNNHHGAEPFYKAVWNSCNPVFAKLAVQLGVDTYYKYVEAFGFRDKTGIQFPGEGTSIFHKKPTDLDLAVTAFGQRFQVTPLQMAAAYCAVANGGELLVPKLVKEITDPSGSPIEKSEKEVVRQVVSPETCKTLLEILQGVVSEGTGSNAYVKGLRIAGKTGTSETVTTKIDGRYIVSFVGIAPADAPEIVCLYILDHPNQYPNTGGALAAPEGGKLIEEILNYLKVERVYSEKDDSELSKSVSVPFLEEKSVSQAASDLTKQGLKVKIVGETGNGSAVTSQMPAAGFMIPEGSTVILYTSREEKTQYAVVPDLTGLSAEEAFQMLNKNNLCMKMYGKGTAGTQSHAAGSKVPIGTIITVDFKMHYPNAE